MEVINGLRASKCFEDAFMAHAFPTTGMNTANGMTNAQLVKYIRTTPATASVVFYYTKPIGPWGTVGYRNVGSTVIHENTYYHDSYSVCDEASSNGHEFLHIVNFDHDEKPTAQRPDSVNYFWNRMTDMCCPTLYPQYAAKRSMLLNHNVKVRDVNHQVPQ